MAALKLGLTDVPVMVAQGWSEAQKRAYVIADNQLALNADWDLDKLRVEIADLQALDFDLGLAGFDPDMIADLLTKPKSEGLTDPDEAPEPQAVVIARAGETWKLGAHVLVCGDAGDETTVKALMGGERADLCLTDPPYGLGSAGKASGKNDYRAYEDTLENLKALAARWLPLAREIADAVVFSPGVTRQFIYPEPAWVLCWFYTGGGQLRLRSLGLSSLLAAVPGLWEGPQPCERSWVSP